MEKMWTLIKKFVKEEEGMEMVEYAVVAALVIIAAVGVWATLGQEIVTRMQAVITAMQGQTT
jgi:pilus assembly protein Flp/PilA